MKIYFYQLIAPAILNDGSFLGLLVWRSESQSDYTSEDKQRIALFMRHLLAKVQFRGLVNMRQNNQVKLFGTKHGLTKTEIEVLSALLDGHSVHSIAKNTKRTYKPRRRQSNHLLSQPRNWTRCKNCYANDYYRRTRYGHYLEIYGNGYQNIGAAFIHKYFYRHFIAPTIITLNDVKACHNPTCYCAMMYIKRQEERISERDLSLNELEIPSQQSIQQDGLYIKRGIIYLFYF